MSHVTVPWMVWAWPDVEMFSTCDLPSTTRQLDPFQPPSWGAPPSAGRSPGRQLPAVVH